MTAHAWDSSTPYCVRCGIQKGWHAEECLATANVVGFMHHLAKRRMAVPREFRATEEGKMMIAESWERRNGEPWHNTTPQPEGKIIVEAFPREPA